MDLEYIRYSTEFQVFDRKSLKIDQKSLAVPMIAMANADGGVIALGVEDDGTLTGVDGNQKHLNELLRVPFDFCVPSVQVTLEYMDVVDVKGEKNHILLLRVAQSMLVHANQADEVFYRVGDKSKKLTFEQRMQLVYAKGAHYFEDAPVNESRMADVDWPVVEDYCRELGYQKGAERYLHEMGFVVEKQAVDGGRYEVLTGAGVLLFARNPQRYFQRARVRVIRYDGVTEKVGTEMNVVKDEMFTGGILKMTNDALAFVKTQIKEHSYLGEDGRFKTVAQYPEFCWTEMVVNSVAHRDYSILGTDIQVKIFDDHLAVESPGVLPGLVRPANIREMHFSRNPKIAAYMHAYGLVKEFGEGVDRMFREMEAAGQPEPRYQAVEFMVRASIWQHEVVNSDQVAVKSAPDNSKFDPVDMKSDQVGSNFDPDLVERYLKCFDQHIAPRYRYSASREAARNNSWQVLMCIKEDEHVSRDAMVQRTGIKLSTLKTLIGYMREADMVDFEGVTSNGKWVVKI